MELILQREVKFRIAGWQIRIIRKGECSAGREHFYRNNLICKGFWNEYDKFINSTKTKNKRKMSKVIFMYFGHIHNAFKFSNATAERG